MISEKPVEFCKTFYNMPELELTPLRRHKSPGIKANYLIQIPPKPMSIMNTQGAAFQVPVPSSHIGPDQPIQVRLVSPFRSNDMVGKCLKCVPSSWPGSNCNCQITPESDTIFFHLHGGGFVSQTSKSHESYLKIWARSLGIPILSVDYSLAPEAPYPRAVEEVLYAYCWMRNNFKLLGTNGLKVIVGGDSAGGNLSIGLILQCIQLSLPKPDHLLAFYPSLLCQMYPSPSRLVKLDVLSGLPHGFLSLTGLSKDCALALTLSIMTSFRWVNLILGLTLVLQVHSYDGSEMDSTGCPAVFEKKCLCGRQTYHYWDDPEELVYVVNCTNRGFTNTDMLDQLPDGIQVLIFTGNNIPTLAWNVLGVWDKHEDLSIVDMSNNKIQEIPGKAFHKVGRVKRLLLNHNNLSVSGRHYHERFLSNFVNLEELHLTNAFTETIDSKWYLKSLKQILVSSNFTKLRTLHLEQNEIWSIEDDDMFCSMPSLSNLHLADNQLQDIDFSLDCLEQLTYLDLQYNKIRRLSERTLKKLDDALKSDGDDRAVHLKGNPFHCDCYLKNFQNWLRNTRTTLHHKDEIRCFDGFPDTNAGLRVKDANISDCTPTHSSTSLTNVLLSILILLVIGVGLLVMYNHRQTIHSSFKPLVVSFHKSMQYRTIDKEEEPPTEVNPFSQESPLDASQPSLVPNVVLQAMERPNLCRALVSDFCQCYKCRHQHRGDEVDLDFKHLPDGDGYFWDKM
eukprot:maker-scaffold291_size219542-snap-gene-0.13 protein:Tk04630 transcript:maker-scaffold291_size219542-snap-gene-0.13-mRNA-1 annotation:"hypothetical protein DAPPUDRAFT_103849"